MATKKQYEAIAAIINRDLPLGKVSVIDDPNGMDKYCLLLDDDAYEVTWGEFGNDGAMLESDYEVGVHNFYLEPYNHWTVNAWEA